MGALFWLSDEQWAAVEPHLPKNQPGARRVDDRRVISGIFHVLKIGCRWQDCPAVKRRAIGTPYRRRRGTPLPAVERRCA
jgi:transposase